MRDGQPSLTARGAAAYRAVHQRHECATIFRDPFAEKILEFLADPAKRERAGEIGRRRIENELSWAHQIPKLIEAYETLFSY